MNLAGYSADGRGILWVREDNGGLNWGMGSAPGYPRDMFVNEPVPERYDQVPLDGVMQARRQAVAVSDAIPGILGDSFSVASGALCMTPDHRALIGDVDALPGLFLVAGCNGVGVQHGPGWGKVAADLITAGASTIDGVEAWNPNRFDRSYTSVAEVYGDLTPLRRPVSHA